MNVLQLGNELVLLLKPSETLWLAKSVGGRIGGATPGKTVMGLCVVRCDTITPLPLRTEHDVFLVKPGTDLGMRSAFLRSFIKNLVLAFFLPANLFSRVGHNRTIYDTICKTIVIEEP
ncbi:protein FAM8A1-like, partial [Nilaparvata lugens]|uniref:protein FAM8A1-like n=1 Tax=Nilaparvata lugens TaxID=108931 RepID=UPI00193EBF24